MVTWTLDDKPQWVIHLYVLLKKNYLLCKRSKRSTAVQLFAPFFFIFFLWVIQKGVENHLQSTGFYSTVKHPDPDTINDIPLCIVGPGHDTCYNFLYSFNNNPVVNDTIDQLIQTICQNNDPPIPLDSILGFPSSGDIDNWLYQDKHQNLTQAALLFDNATMEAFTYVIQVNETKQYIHGQPVGRMEYISLPFQYAIEKQLFKVFSGNENAELNLQYVEFAHPQVIVVNVVGENAGIFILAASIFNLIVALGQIITEKEAKIRQTMHQMGLQNWTYWLSWGITHSIVNTITCLVLIISGCIFQFDLFLKNNFFVYFFFLWEFSMTMVPIGFIVSTFLHEARSVTISGFLVFLTCFIAQITVASFFIADVMTDSMISLFSLVSPCLLSKGLWDLGRFTDEDSDNGISWSDRNDYDDISGTEKDPMPIGWCMNWFVLDWILYLVITTYLDNVIPNAYGVRKPYFYFLKGSYWTGKPATPSHQLLPDKPEEYTPRPETDEDVQEEERQVITDSNPRQMMSPDGEGLAVVIHKLRREFPNPEATKKKKKNKKGEVQPDVFVAVDDLSLRFFEKKLFCLLGHNGAGKTTTISMLTGLLPPTSGDALVEGRSISDSMDEIGKLMGVCPQFDVLWPDLTGREHLEIFAAIKGSQWAQLEREVMTRLREVELIEAQNVRTKYYSGGMRRRLSVAISFIGNPTVVYLDEPTTGMDPISRRQVWNIIQAAKKDKTIILTTHSMEEADVLADTIGIMGKGRLRCIGTPLRLKNKFGAGYQVIIQTRNDPQSIERIVTYVRRQIPEVIIGSVTFGFVAFSLSQELIGQMKVLFKSLEVKRQELEILDIQLSLTTLEEVFLQVSHLLAQEEKNEDGKEDLFDSSAVDPNQENNERERDTKYFSGHPMTSTRSSE